MKAIQITLEESLLAELDASEEVRREGRSAVLRRAAAEYLARRRRREISEGYARAYGESGGLGEELAGWEDQGQWPVQTVPKERLRQFVGTVGRRKMAGVCRALAIAAGCSG